MRWKRRVFWVRLTAKICFNHWTMACDLWTPTQCVWRLLFLLALGLVRYSFVEWQGTGVSRDPQRHGHFRMGMEMTNSRLVSHGLGCLTISTHWALGGGVGLFVGSVRKVKTQTRNVFTGEQMFWALQSLRNFERNSLSASESKSLLTSECHLSNLSCFCLRAAAWAGNIHNDPHSFFPFYTWISFIPFRLFGMICMCVSRGHRSDKESCMEGHHYLTKTHALRYGRLAGRKIWQELLFPSIWDVQVNWL